VGAWRRPAGVCRRGKEPDEHFTHGSLVRVRLHRPRPPQSAGSDSWRRPDACRFYAVSDAGPQDCAEYLCRIGQHPPIVGRVPRSEPGVSRKRLHLPMFTS
jgi:hypothetical protein